jgi:hypothetical protein
VRNRSYLRRNFGDTGGKIAVLKVGPFRSVKYGDYYRKTEDKENRPWVSVIPIKHRVEQHENEYAPQHKHQENMKRVYIEHHLRVMNFY